MQLAIDALDASGKAVGTTSTWVLGGVPPRNRAYFSTHAVPAASYRVQGLFFDWGKGGGLQWARSTRTHIRLCRSKKTTYTSPSTGSTSSKPTNEADCERAGGKWKRILHHYDLDD